MSNHIIVSFDECSEAVAHTLLVERTQGVNAVGQGLDAYGACAALVRAHGYGATLQRFDEQILGVGQLCSRCNLRRHLHHRTVAGKQSFAKRNTRVVILRVGGSFLQRFALVAIAVDSTDGIVKLRIARHKQLATLSAHRYQVACVGGIYWALV